jgi:uncharacterized protein (TIGR02001 family)
VFLQLMGCSMKLTQGLAAFVLLATAAAANAELTGTVTATSDYNWRGITQSAQDPALQGSIDYSMDSGFYAGAWASNVDFGNCCDENLEVDLYAGFRGGSDVTWDVGFIYYAYPGAEDLDYPEIYGSLGYKWFVAKLSYSSDFANYSEQAWYLEGNAAYELPANFGLQAHVGYSTGDGIEEAYSARDDFGNIVDRVDSYFDWSIGVTYALGNFDLGLKYADGSDLETLDGTTDDIASSEGAVIFTVATTFPWGGDE